MEKIEKLELRKAQANYYARRFGVKVNPENEVIVTLGSKEGLANLAQAIAVITLARQ